MVGNIFSEVLSHHSVDGSNLALKLERRVHKSALNIFVTNFINDCKVLVSLVIDLLNFFVGFLSLLASLRLQVLNKLENLGFSELKLRLQEDIWARVIDGLEIYCQFSLSDDCLKLDLQSVSQNICVHHCLVV